MVRSATLISLATQVPYRVLPLVRAAAAMLDRLFTSTIPWDAFYADRGQPIPFFGPMAYSPEDLRWIFPDLAEVEMRPMAEQPQDSALFGVPFLLTALFRRPAQITTR